MQTEAVRKDIAGIEALIAEEPTLGPLRANWRELRADLDRATATTIEGATAQQSFGAHTEVVRKLLSWMLDIGDVSGLAADASPALYHLNLTQIRTLPEFIESVANLRGYASSQFLARGADHHLTFELTSRLVAVNIAETALHARIDRISDILPGGLSMRSPKIRELHETVRYIRNTARYGATLPSSAIDAIDFFEVATLAIDQATHIHRTDLYPQSRALLDARLADQRRALEHHLVAVGGVFMVIATLFAAMYVSIRRSVSELNRGSSRFARGDLDARVDIRSQDELREVGQHFNDMAGEITYLIDAQRIQALRLAGLLRNNPSVVFALDPQTLKCTFLSPNAEALFGPLPNEASALAGCWIDAIDPQQRAVPTRAVEFWRDRGCAGALRGAYRLVERPQGAAWIEIQFSAVLDEAGAISEIVGSCTDITEQQNAHTRLELAASVFSSAREGIIITDAAGCILQVNDAFTQITGYARDEILGKNPRVLQSGRQEPGFYQAMWADLLDQGYWEGEVWNRHKSGRAFAETIAIAAVRDQAGSISHYVALFSDITRQKENEERLRHLAHFDPLTGLPNRTLLADRIQQALAQSRRSGKLVAVAFIDLDGFKAVNDEHGHDAGDALLVAVSRRMKDALRTEDTVSRLGGDEFVAVISALDDRENIEQPAARLLAAISKPIQLEAATVMVSGSIGIAFCTPGQGIDPEHLMRQADQAMYAAKQAGKNRYVVFDGDQVAGVDR